MIKFRQPIKLGDKGRDVKAVKDALLKMEVKGSGKMDKHTNEAGKSFVACIKTVQKIYKLKVDGVYGPKTHAHVAPHFSLFDKWRYRTAKIRKAPAPTSAVAAAKRLVELHSKGKFRDDRGTVFAQIEASAQGKPVRNAIGQEIMIDARVLEALVWLIDDKGFGVGCFALCSDHPYDGTHGHAHGHAVDISSIDGISVTSSSVKPTLIRLLSAIHSPGDHKPWQLINGGFANHRDPQCSAYCIPAADSYYGAAVMQEHTNHVHVGYYGS